MYIPNLKKFMKYYKFLCSVSSAGHQLIHQCRAPAYSPAQGTCAGHQRNACSSAWHQLIHHPSSAASRQRVVTKMAGEEETLIFRVTKREEDRTNSDELSMPI